MKDTNKDKDKIQKHMDKLREELKVLEKDASYGYVLDDKCDVETFFEIFKGIGTTFKITQDQYNNLSPKAQQLFKLQ